MYESRCCLENKYFDLILFDTY
jgi:hypothetical protein